MMTILRNTGIGLFLAGIATVAPANAQLPAPLPNIDSATNPSGPRIQFATNVFDFGRAKSGEAVKCVYYFTNTGDRTLELSQVQPQCGCTAATNWSRRVEPGETGIIPIQFNTANYNGAVIKHITVFCNITNQQTVSLQLRGTLWKPIEYTPTYAVLNVMPDAGSGSTVVRLLNNTDEPVYLSPPDCNNRALLATVRTNQPGKEYEIEVSTAPPLNPGSLQAIVTVKTTSTNAPVVSIPVWMNVQPMVMVMPQQVVLPPVSTNRATPTITIQNNSTNALTISDPTINVPGVDVKVNAIQTGRVYTVVFSFPPGFEVAAHQPIVFTAKTSHAQNPVIKVPVIQIPRPALPAFPATPAMPTAMTPVPPKPAPASQALAKPGRQVLSIPPLPPGTPQ